MHLLESECMENIIDRLEGIVYGSMAIENVGGIAYE